MAIIPEDITEIEYNEFKMSLAEYKEIADLSERNNSGEIPNSILLIFWERLGKKYGFKWETAQASAKGGRYFLAIPELQNYPKEMEVIEPLSNEMVNKYIN